MIRVKRVYEPPSQSDGSRVLVDRLWPRGVKKDALHLEAWLRQVAPSNQLRKWFGHDPARWDGFQDRYFAELEHKPETWAPLILAAQKGDVSLLFSAHDSEHNNAVALKAFLEKHLHGRS